MKIIQIVESLAIGDAVANDAVAIDGLLKTMKVCGGIYVTNERNIAKRYLHKIAAPISELPIMDIDEDDIILFHHAIANDFCYELPKICCHKILIYHNITPPEFFAGVHDGFEQATRKGLEQLRYLNNDFDCCIADSEFNKMDLIKFGYTCPIYVCPVLIPFEDYEQKPTPEIIQKYSDGRKNILFVGRLSPNKKQEDIIKAFAIYKKYYDQDARLFLVGSDGVESYGKALREYVKQLNVDNVIITGSVPFKDILAYYTIADVFICMSEHEGFCVPLIEAMYFNVPILAYDSCAIPYTLGESGVLLKNKDYLLAAGWLNHLANDCELRETIVQAQKKRLEYFLYNNTSENMKGLLENLLKQFIKEKDQPICLNELKQDGTYDEQSFVLVMPIKASDWEVARRGIPYIRKNLKPRKVIIVSSSELKRSIKEENDVVFIDENKLLPGMTFEKVKKIIAKAGGDPRFAGWFLQQFLKLGFSRVSHDNYYLVWDADTLPLNPITFFDEKTNKPYLNLKREYVQAYFDTIKRLLTLNKEYAESFITEHMLFDVELTQEMLNAIEANANVKGDTFWEKCIYACDFSKYQQAFSEYETFGTYVTTQHPERYETRKLRTFRCGTDFLGENPSSDMLDWVAKDFDTISFEHWSAPIQESINLCKQASVREEMSFADLVRYICDTLKIKAITGGHDEQEIYRMLCLKMEFDYFFGNKPVYSDSND